MGVCTVNVVVRTIISSLGVDRNLYYISNSKYKECTIETFGTSLVDVPTAYELKTRLEI